ncbi:hypothetical protein J2S53_001649 [Actinopolyspora lacussalsi]|uniref:Uncharacterized protein n=1 Tax=Actinopolyspora alba TaxID=673379 RepID=A0A1I1XNB8_9ACTN|nr:hypothetical protein [Actinopolyspora lacussalsi]SFE08852.1 hypothetical protein SAMN04487819_107296 [Actinopolyspora alba]
MASDNPLWSGPTNTESAGDPTRTVRVWIDHTGTVHERHTRDTGRTLCGLNAGPDHDIERGPRICATCVGIHLDAEASGANTG